MVPKKFPWNKDHNGIATRPDGEFCSTDGEIQGKIDTFFLFFKRNSELKCSFFVFYGKIHNRERSFFSVIGKSEQKCNFLSSLEKSWKKFEVFLFFKKKFRIEVELLFASQNWSATFSLPWINPEKRCNFFVLQKSSEQTLNFFFFFGKI